MKIGKDASAGTDQATLLLVAEIGQAIARRLTAIEVLCATDDERVSAIISALASLLGTNVAIVAGCDRATFQHLIEKIAVQLILQFDPIVVSLQRNGIGPRDV